VYIEYKTRKLKKCCLEFKRAKRTWNKRQAEKVAQRINEIAAAPTLDDLYKLPPAGCHQLTADLKGKLAVNLVHPYRLIFEPLGEKDDIYTEGALDRRKVVGVRILGVGDYH